MRRHRYQLNLFSYCDAQGVCRRLERMAAKGWQLDDIGLLWRYRRAPAQALTYEAVYCDDAEPLAPHAGEGAQPLVDYCAQERWELAAQWEKMLIFSNPYPDPVPIDTDPQVQLDAMHRVMAGRPLIAPVLLALVVAVFGALLLFWLPDSLPLLLLSDISLALSLLLLCLLPILILMDPLAYLWWHRRARRAVALGEPWPPFFRWPAVATGVTAALLAVLLVVNATLNPADGLPTVLGALGVLLVLSIFYAVRRLMRHLGTASWLNQAVSLLVLVVLWSVLWQAVLPWLRDLGAQGVFGGSPAEAVTLTSDRGAETDLLRRDALPLTLEDLVVSGGQLSYELEQHASPLLSLTSAQQRPAFSNASFTYEIAQVRIPGLIPWVQELITECHRDQLNLQPDPRSTYRPAPDGLWPVEQALQRYRGGQALSVYLLREGSTVVYLSLPDDLSLTPAAVDTICEKLFP